MYPFASRICTSVFDLVRRGSGESAKCRMQSAKCEVQSAECRVQSAKCGVRSLVVGFASSELRSFSPGRMAPLAGPLVLSGVHRPFYRAFYLAPDRAAVEGTLSIHYPGVRRVFRCNRKISFTWAKGGAAPLGLVLAKLECMDEA